MRPQKRNERGTLPRFSRGERSCKQSVMAGQVPERRSPRPKRHKQQLTPAEGQRLPLTAREADEELLPEVVGFWPCCLAVWRMLVSTAWARAPFWVRFPPQFLRAPIRARMARSAALLVASRPGQ